MLLRWLPGCSMTVLLQSGPGFVPMVMVELDHSWWKEHSEAFPAVFLSASPHHVWCELNERLLRKLLLTDDHSFQVTDSVLEVSAGGDQRIAVLPASALSSLHCVSTYLGLDGLPRLLVFGKAFPIELTPSLYVADDGRVGAPRGSFLERWGVADLLRIKAIADYWR